MRDKLRKMYLDSISRSDQTWAEMAHIESVLEAAIQKYRTSNDPMIRAMVGASCLVVADLGMKKAKQIMLEEGMISEP